jgi:predicted nucleic acid-binding protein
MKICLDTYALMELHDHNPEYAQIFDKEWVVTELTLAEFYALLYRKHNEKTADYWCAKFTAFSTPVPLELLLKATKFRIDNAEQNLSFFDCVGYIYAQEHGMQFVTGDKQFKGRPGVLFVK